MFATRAGSHEGVHKPRGAVKLYDHLIDTGPDEHAKNGCDASAVLHGTEQPKGVIFYFFEGNAGSVRGIGGTKALQERLTAFSRELRPGDERTGRFRKDNRQG